MDTVWVVYFLINAAAVPYLAAASDVCEMLPLNLDGFIAREVVKALVREYNCTIRPARDGN